MPAKSLFTPKIHGEFATNGINWVRKQMPPLDRLIGKGLAITNRDMRFCCTIEPATKAEVEKAEKTEN